MLTNDHLMQAFESAGAAEGVTYLSVPLTSGIRLIQFLDYLAASDEELDAIDPARVQKEVLELNVRDARRAAQILRSLRRIGIVVDPSCMLVEGWSQFDYNSFWFEMISTFPTTVALQPGWEYSAGSRSEVGLAISRKLSFIDLQGEEMSVHEVETIADSAVERIAHQFPNLDLSKLNLPNLRSPQHFTPSAASQAFEWLVRERTYQVNKFGTVADDKHTLQGLNEDGWWWQQLMNYFHRARILGLEIPGGRQALAKFVATGCGLLESVVRTHGPLPAPGVPSGEVRFVDDDLSA